MRRHAAFPAEVPLGTGLPGGGVGAVPSSPAVDGAAPLRPRGAREGFSGYHCPAIRPATPQLCALLVGVRSAPQVAAGLAGARAVGLRGQGRPGSRAEGAQGTRHHAGEAARTKVAGATGVRHTGGGQVGAIVARFLRKKSWAARERGAASGAGGGAGHLHQRQCVG